MAATDAPPAYESVSQPVGQQQMVTQSLSQNITAHHSVTAQSAPGTANPQPRSGNWKGILWTGVIQVVLGSLTVFLGIVTLSTFKAFIYMSDIGSPIWCGVLFYVGAGTLGIVSGRKKHSGLAIGYMVMSILACLATCCVIGFGAARMSAINDVCHPIYKRYRYSYENPPSSCYLQAAVNGVYATLILLALAEFVVAIVGASMTCGPLCSGASTTQTVIQYQAQPHTVVTTQPQQPAFYNIPAGRPQPHVAYPFQQGQYPQAQAFPTAHPAQQGLYPQTQAPPTEQQCQELTK